MIFETISAECSHEKILRKFYREKCAYDGPTVFSAPLLLIGFTNRCGSNLLAGYLRAAKGVAGFQEQLNHDTVVNVSRAQAIKSFPDYIRHVSKGAERHGFKASVEQVAMLYRLGIAQMYPSVRVLHITRRDTLSQAVSFSIADQTKQWTARQAKQSDAYYGKADIDRRLDWIAIQNESMRVAAKVFGFRYGHITYEDLVASPLEVVARSAGFFGLTAPETLPEPKLTRQADAVNTEFIAHYLRDVWHP
jgi:trehalose 2-sulfotransferase